jgi:predicted ferric reductase
LVALVLAAVVFGVLAGQVRAGASAAVVEMPFMVRSGGIWAYTVSQALGFAAVVWSWGTLLLGLAVANRPWRWWPRGRGRVERLHRSTSLTLVVLIAVHAVVLVWDGMGDTPWTVLVPFVEPFEPARLPIAVGLVSLYLSLVTGVMHYLPRLVGRRVWRVCHRVFVPVVYVCGVWHTFWLGSDVTGGVWVGLWVMQVPVALMLGFRLACAGPVPRAAAVPA